MTQKDIAACLKISHGSVHHIVHDVLQFHKVSGRWVRQKLTTELRERRVDACEELLGPFEQEANGFLERIVTGAKPGFKSATRKRRERARIGAIPHHQSQRSFEQNHQQGRLC